MTELLEDVRRRVLGIRRADWVHETKPTHIVKQGAGKSMAGTIERFRSTVYSRMKKAEHYANKEDLDKAWKELDAAMISIQSLTKAINIARHEGVMRESHEGNALSDDMFRLMDTVRFRFQRAEQLAAQGLEDDAWSEIEHAQAAFQAMMGESTEFSEGTLTENMQAKKWYIYDGKHDSFLGYVLQIMGNGSAKMLKISAYGTGKPVQDMADKTFAAQSWKPVDPKHYKKAMAKIQNHPKFQ